MSTSVLLPAARVDIYGLDKKTVECANSLIRDWRFSRVALRVENQGIDKAIEDYEQHTSPDLVIIEVDDIGDSFLEKLESLAEHCVEETDAIIIGPQNDVHLYRQLIGMGVKDYLVSPANEKDLGDVIAQTLLDKKGLSDSHIIAVIGSKGGVGTSTVSHILASTIADNAGHKTLLLDAAGGWGSLSIPFGAQITTTLQEAVIQVENASNEDIKRLLHDDTEKLTLLPSGGGTLLETICDEDSFENMIDHFMKTYPVIVVDLSAADNALQKLVLRKAHNIIVVTSPLLPSLRTCRSLLKEITTEISKKDKKPNLIINMQGICKADEVANKDIEKILEYEITLNLPYDTKLFIGNEAKEKEVSRSKDSEKVLKPLTDFANTLLPEIKTNTTEKEKNSDKNKQGFLSKLLHK